MGERVSVFTGLFRGQVAGLFDSLEAQSRRREFCDLRTAFRSDLHLEHLRADQAAGGAFVHREEMAPHPVPAVTGVEVVDADHHFHFGLAPKARMIGPAEPDARIKVRVLQLAIAAEEFDSGWVLWIFA